MDLRVKEVMCNLRNYDFEELGPYKMDETEAKKLLDGLDEMIMLWQQQIDEARNDEEIRILHDIINKLDPCQNDAESANC